MQTYEQQLKDKPRSLSVMVDESSPLMCKDFKDFLSGIGIHHRAISGQAHGPHGTAEGHIKTMRRTMAKLTAEFPALRPATILSLAVMGHNGGESVHGSSPFFWSDSRGYIDENATLTYDRMRSQIEEGWPESSSELDGASVTAASHRFPGLFLLFPTFSYFSLLFPTFSYFFILFHTFSYFFTKNQKNKKKTLVRGGRGMGDGRLVGGGRLTSE